MKFEKGMMVVAVFDGETFDGTIRSLTKSGPRVVWSDGEVITMTPALRRKHKMVVSATTEDQEKADGKDPRTVKGDKGVKATLVHRYVNPVRIRNGKATRVKYEWSYKKPIVSPGNVAVALSHAGKGKYVVENEHGYVGVWIVDNSESSFLYDTVYYSPRAEWSLSKAVKHFAGMKPLR